LRSPPHADKSRRASLQFGQSFYYEIKAAMVVWLMFFNGAEKVFTCIVEPFMAA